MNAVSNVTVFVCWYDGHENAAARELACAVERKGLQLVVSLLSKCSGTALAACASMDEGYAHEPIQPQ